MSTAAISLRNIYKRFGSLEVLKGISFEASQGEVVSILGSSGSGKSTLLRCTNLLEIPDQSKIIVGGETIAMKVNRQGQNRPACSKQIDRIRTQLGMVFQNFNLWSHKTVLENVIEAPIHVLKRAQQDAKEHAEQLLEKVGLTDKRHYYPSHLSGGQQQRAAIACVLTMSPKVMLFSEPTLALDPELVGEVLRVMRQLADEGMTMLVVTHEMDFASEVSNRLVFLHQGEIEEQGTPEQMLTARQSARFRQFIASW